MASGQEQTPLECLEEGKLSQSAPTCLEEPLWKELIPGSHGQGTSRFSCFSGIHKHTHFTTHTMETIWLFLAKKKKSCDFAVLQMLVTNYSGTALYNLWRSGACNSIECLKYSCTRDLYSGILILSSLIPLQRSPCLVVATTKHWLDIYWGFFISCPWLYSSP